MIVRGGKPVSVILPIKDYEALLDQAEEMEDRAAFKAAREGSASFRPLQDYLNERRGAGL